MYVDKNGTPIPLDHFENEVGHADLPFDPAQKKKFNAETEALMKFKNTGKEPDEEESDDEDE